jgi:type VI secretion system secreted protein VgrG
MAQKLSQDTRIVQLTTPLGKDELVLVRLDGTEGLSELFEYRVEALSEKADINFDQAIGKQCCVKVKQFNKEREFNGILVEAQWLGVHNDFYLYRLVLRPWLWLLSQKADCRIFQEKKVPEILKEVFGDASLGKFEVKVSDEGPKRDYCVQYRETDLNFVSRLMEKEGFYYFFKHEGGDHTLVVVDSPNAHQPCKGLATVPFLPPGGSYVRKEPRIYDWTSRRRHCTGKVELNDYDYENPNTSLMADANASESYSNSKLEVYDYPGNYNDRSAGARYAKIQLESEQALDHRRHGKGEAVSLFPGGTTKLEGHPSTEQNKEYLVVRCSHSFVAENYRSVAGIGPTDEIYYGHYEFQLKMRPFRAPLVTPKPLIHGIQTALVVTKDKGGSEEIDVEKLTEIYVRFYWDRKGSRSCKLRCAQVWSGKQWGGQFIPRVGMEVVVEFLEGDPDRPLVVGCVYNDDNKPPHELPGKKNIAGVKSDSTKGHGGYNEMNFDDTKKSEKVTFHAEKDHAKTVKHAETTEIGETFEVPLGSPSREVTIKNGDDKLTVKSGDHNLEVSTGNQKIKINLTQKTDVGVQIEIICGPGPQSKITMNPAEIKLEAMMITLDAQILLKLHGMMVQMQGDAMTQIQGGIVMIN